MSEFEKAEVKEAFKHYFLTGPVMEDWEAWSKLFTADAVYFDHYYGRFRGPQEIEWFLESTMSYGCHVYSPLEWYNIEGNRIVYKVINRADSPEPGGAPFEFPSLQIIHYAGDGKWRSEEDWWIPAEMRKFAKGYAEACRRFDPDFAQKLSRADWGTIGWARPPAGHQAMPSWVGKEGIPEVRRLEDMTFGERV